MSKKISKAPLTKVTITLVVEHNDKDEPAKEMKLGVVKMTDAEIQTIGGRVTTYVNDCRRRRREEHTELKRRLDELAADAQERIDA